MKIEASSSEAGRSQGHTFVELVVSLTVFGAVMTIALSFLQVQNQGFRKGLDYMSSVQSLRYAVGSLERDIQTAGTNLVPGQPEVVYAGEAIMAFNSDYATRAKADPFAVFFDPDLEDGVVNTWVRSQRETLPGTNFVYPDSTYMNDAGRPGPAETLIFFFSPDTETTREDDYALFRQVNAQEPELVAKNLLRVEGEPFFRYLIETDTGVDSIPDGLLPLTHEVPIHESQAGTGRVSMVDGIRAVRVTLMATNGKLGEQERTSKVTRIVRMPNMGFGLLDICGSRPGLGTVLSAAVSVAGTGETVVDLTWGRSTDDGQGENDIVRYVIWRRLAGSANWDEPYLSIPAGGDNYIYQDADVAMGETYEYALAAQDCTPNLSSMTTAPSVTIPVR
jgi:hypothetical protein